MFTKVSSIALILLIASARAEGENDLFTGNSEQPADVQSKSDSWEAFNKDSDVAKEDEIAESKGEEVIQEDEVTENLPQDTTTNEVETEDAMEGTGDHESSLEDNETEYEEEEETENEEDTEYEEETDTMEIGSEEDDDVVDQVSCKCKDKTNKALISSLQACTNAVSVLQNCKKPKKQSTVSKKALTSCKCSAKLTAALTKSLKSCTDALGTMTSCKGGGKKVTASSCAGVLKKNPNAGSGYYNLKINGKTQKAYCFMGRLCGRKGGWTRFAYFNANKMGSCPSGLQLYKTKATKMCGKAAKSGAGCVSINLPSSGLKYSTVCGRVKGYQKGSTDAFSKRGINSMYLDGVSITRGSPRKHIWSLAVGHSERRTDSAACPCNTGASKASLPPAFVGSNYYCESGWVKSQSPANRILYGDALWDGKQMRRRETSCRVSMMPWFRRDIGSTTSDNLEMRICTDEPASNENVGIGNFAIFVK